MSEDRAPHRVVFAPSGLTARSTSGTHGARRCSRRRCRSRLDVWRARTVRTLPGGPRRSASFPKWQIESDAAALTGWTSTEDDYTGRRPIGDGQRLGCAAQVCGDVVVEIPAASQVHRQVVRKSVDVGDLQHRSDGPVALRRAARWPNSAPKSADSREQIVRGTARATSTSRRRGIDAHVLPLLARRAKRRRQRGHRRRAQRDATSARCTPATSIVRSASRSTSDRRRSPAISSTSRPARVLATNGVMNPQIRFGDDLMSRVSYVMMNPGGEVELTRTVRPRSTR